MCERILKVSDSEVAKTTGIEGKHDTTPDVRRVCSACFEDESLKEIINSRNGSPGCSFCDGHDSTTSDVVYVFEYIRARIEAHFTSDDYSGLFCVKNAGIHENLCWGRYPSDVLLRKIINLQLPRDKNHSLFAAICDEALGNHKWASRDYGRVSRDKELELKWWMFTIAVKYCRRFSLNVRPVPDGFTAREIFDEILPYMKTLTRPVLPGYKIYRVRKSQGGEQFDSVDQLGPPPPHLATQSNRMNPPGIPYFYGSDKQETAMAETCVESSDAYSVGIFETIKPLQILDLSALPNVGGWFSEDSLQERQVKVFLHTFSSEISKPISGDDRINLDYIPTQAFTELVRDNLKVHGIKYKSSKVKDSSNIVLFVTPNEIEGAMKRPSCEQKIPKHAFASLEIIRLVKVNIVKG